MSIRDYAYLAVIVALAAAGWYLYQQGYSSGIAVGDKRVAKIQLEDAQNLAKLQADARAAERAQIAKFNEIAEQRERENVEAQAKADRVIADLRAGTLRLRREWAGQANQCVPGTGAAASVGDANAELREQSASRIVRVAAEADAQIRELQAVIREYRARALSAPQAQPEADAGAWEAARPRSPVPGFIGGQRLRVEMAASTDWLSPAPSPLRALPGLELGDGSGGG